MIEKEFQNDLEIWFMEAGFEAHDPEEGYTDPFKKFHSDEEKARVTDGITREVLARFRDWAIEQGMPFMGGAIDDGAKQFIGIDRKERLRYWE